MIGMCFVDVGADAGRILNNVNFVGISVTYLSYTSMLPAVLRLPLEVPFIRKENFNNYYNLRTYYVMYISITIPQQILYALTYTLISYVMTAQLLTLQRYTLYLLAAIMVNLISDTIGQIIGSLLTANNGTFIAGVSLAYFILFSGFLVAVKQSVLASILMYTSYHRFALNILIAAVHGFNREALPCLADYCHYNVRSISEEYSFNVHPVYLDVVYLFGTYLSFCLIGYYTLKYATRKC